MLTTTTRLIRQLGPALYVKAHSNLADQVLMPRQDFLLDPYTYNYMNSTFQAGDEPPRSHEGEYITDVLALKAYRLLEEAQAQEKPFFLTVAPSAPHVNIEMHGSPFDDNFKVNFSPPVAAKRHQHLFQDVKVPRTKNFNPDNVCRFKAASRLWHTDM